MKNRKLAVIVSGFLVSVLVPLAAWGAEFRTGDQPRLAANEVTAGNLYLAGGNVTSSGRVGGDLTAAGGTLLVNGPVAGDILAGGGSLTIIGDVTGDLRFGGGNTVIQGLVGGDVTGGGGQVMLSGARVGGDVVVAGGSVTLDAPVAGNARLAGGEIRINAPISGNLTVMADKVTLGPRALISGSFTYTASKAATLETGAVVKGETKFNERLSTEPAATKTAAFFSFWVLIKLLMALAGALILGYFFRRYARELVAKAAARPWLEAGRGLILLIIWPIISIVLLVTVVGIPIGLIGLLAYAAALIFTCLATPLVIGSLVHKWIWKPAEHKINWKTILLGVIVAFLLGLIPLLGWIVKFIFTLITLGAVLSIKWKVAKEWA
jgi:cytoskeletal protein CcmA (bactofilin family)